jgi:hypothetical protein
MYRNKNPAAQDHRDDRDAPRRNRKRKRAKPFTLGERIRDDLRNFIRYEFGASLPDDDYGRDVLRELLNQLTLNGAGADVLRDRALDLLPEMDDGDLDLLIREISAGRKCKADDLAADRPRLPHPDHARHPRHRRMRQVKGGAGGDCRPKTRRRQAVEAGKGRGQAAGQIGPESKALGGRGRLAGHLLPPQKPRR